MKTYVYLVSYSTGAYDDWTPHHIFVTIDHEKAVRYRDKFNRILDALKEHHSEVDEDGEPCWSADNYRIMETNQCYIEPIELRK